MSQTGLVIFDLTTIQPVEMYTIQTKSKDGHGKRLYDIYKTLQPVIKKYPPKVLSLERGYTKHNVATQVLYRVHGLINFIFWKCPQYYYPPTTVKATILNGKAKKEEVQQAILERYPNIKFKTEDESDAFAVGLTYFIKNNLLTWNKN